LVVLLYQDLMSTKTEYPAIIVLSPLFRRACCRMPGGGVVEEIP